MATRKTATNPPQGRPASDAPGIHRHGLGSLYRRNRTWWIQVWFRNQRYRESSGSESRADAVRLLRQRLADIGKGQAPAGLTERLLLDDVAKILLDDYAVNERKNVYGVRRCIGKVLEFFGLGARAVDVTTDRLNAFVKHRRAEGAAASTIRNELAAVKRALNLAVRAGRLPSRPVFPCIEVRNTRSGFFEQHEFDAVYQHLPDHVRPVAKFLYLTGWRSGEVLPLTWSQVSLAAGIVRLEPGTTKNEEGRVLPFSALPELATVMEEQRKRTDDAELARGEVVPWVFHNRGIPFRSFRKSWMRACAAARVTRIPHDFRRTAVRNLERAGVPRSVAMKLTGHKTESVYRRYAIVSESDLAEGMAKLARLRENVGERAASSGRGDAPAGRSPRGGRRSAGARRVSVERVESPE